jgi:hypothetical protein
MDLQNKIEYLYFIDPDISYKNAVDIRDNLESLVWKIAREQNVEEVLRQSNFSVRVSENAPDLGSIIDITVCWIESKAITSITDPSVNEIQSYILTSLWEHEFYPRIKNVWGNILREKI